MAEEHKAKFSTLFAALMFFVAAIPFLRAGAVGAVILQVLFTVLLVSGLNAVLDDGKRALTVTVAFAVPALVLLWAGRVLSNLTLSGVGGVLLAAFLTITAVEILKYIVRARRVTSQVVFGSVSVYLMMGIVGALLFSAALGARRWRSRRLRGWCPSDARWAFESSDST